MKISSLVFSFLFSLIVCVRSWIVYISFSDDDGWGVLLILLIVYSLHIAHIYIYSNYLIIQLFDEQLADQRNNCYYNYYSYQEYYYYYNYY